MRRHPTNRYPGVNAHFNSYIQQPNGTFSSFHDKLLNVIQETLDEALPENYRAINEKGLQISFIAEDDIQQGGTRPDVAILQLSPSQEPQTSSGSSPTARIPFAELGEEIAEENILIRVGIYEANQEDVLGKLVTTIELLSAANKPHGSNFASYMDKRLNHLQAGINLLEIDFLHESHPILKRIPSYLRREQNAFPYNILVNLPEPAYADWFGIPVDKALPQLVIPLAANESILFDLQAAYNEAFRRVKHYQDKVDYDTLPVNFNAYSEDDQKRIQSILEEIRA